MHPSPFLPAATLCAAFATPGLADITVSFRDSAPKDIFVLHNASGCDLGAVRITLDLSGSASGLIFDTTAQGAGVEVFQPFEIVSGGGYLAGVPQVLDGMNRLDLSLTRFPADGRVQFTIDVDDTLPRSQWGQIRVSGGEMAGAEVIGLDRRASFNAEGLAVLPVTACLG